jgi:AraC family ethanolamine operon transcriptional activator
VTWITSDHARPGYAAFEGEGDMTASGFRYDAHDEPEQCAAALAGIAFHTVPCAATRFRTMTAVHRLGEARLVIVDSSANYTLAEAKPGTAVIQVPMSGHETYTINGAALQGGDYFLYGPGSGFERASTARAVTALLMLPPAVAETTLPGPAAEAFAASRPAAARKATPAGWLAFRMLMAEAGRQRVPVNDPDARRGFRAAVFEVFRELVTPEDRGGGVAPRRDAPSRHSIVRRADAYLRENVGRPIYTEDLCAALDVAPATLSAAFRATFGISPHRFLKLRRLAMVRASLRAHQGSAPLVKSVALAHGFWHLGQFARDYQAAYGELPSETLAQAA